MTSLKINTITSDTSLTITQPITLGSIAPTFPTQLGSNTFSASSISSSINVLTGRVTSSAGISLVKGIYLCSVNTGYFFDVGTTFTSCDYTQSCGMTQTVNDTVSATFPSVGQNAGDSRYKMGSSTVMIGENCYTLGASVVLIVPSVGTYYASGHLYNTATSSTTNPKVWSQLISCVRIG